MVCAASVLSYGIELHPQPLRVVFHCRYATTEFILSTFFFLFNWTCYLFLLAVVVVRYNAPNIRKRSFVKIFFQKYRQRERNFMRLFAH